jgi:DegV family protein with EDD domain
MKYKIISDSSCDIRSLKGDVPFATVPLHIVTAEHDYTDDAALDVAELIEHLRKYKGKSHTSCPNVTDWEKAFGDADAVFAVTITSALSGSYNAALCAKAIYESEYPGRKVHVVDSRATGPLVVLLIEELHRLILEELPFEEIVDRITAYQQQTEMLFVLSSIQNLARNGRISKIKAEAVGFLGIRLLGRASEEGTLEILSKCRGEEAAQVKLVLQMEKSGWRHGRVALTHCQNETGAKKLRAALHEIHPDAPIELMETGGLCSFYAEQGGILVGCECR